MIHRNELLFSLASGLAALSAIVALPNMVAKPKLLFGRSLSAMEPTLFPYITLLLILVLSVLSAIFAVIAYFHQRHQPAAHTGLTDASAENKPLLRVSIFFVTLVAYGLMLKPVGFLVSSFIVLTVISLLLGNRSWLQILLFAVISPVCLYLLATRVLLVSLPELDAIELFYAGIINRFNG